MNHAVNQMKLVLSLSGEQADQLRSLADKECLPMTTLAKQIIFKYLAQLATQQPQ